MKKRIIFALLLAAIITVMLAIGVSADELVDEYNISYSSYDNVWARIYMTDKGLSLVVSGEGNVSNNASSILSAYKNDIRTATFEDGVTRIPSSMLRDAYSLEEVTIGETVREIGAYAFCGCKNLYSANIPGSVERIQNNTFRECYSLSYVSIGDGVRRIEDNVFTNCQSLTEIYIPDEVEYIGREAFKGCRALKSVHLPECLATIGMYAFAECVSLYEIDIPRNTKEILTGAFANCNSLISVYIPMSVYRLEGNVFVGCRSLEIFVEGPEDIESTWASNWNPLRRPVYYFSTHAHKFEIAYTVEPTHNSDGETHYICTECEYGYIVTVSKIPHNYSSEVLKESTHTEMGERLYYCECGYSYTESIAVVPHSYTVTTVPATHLAEGKNTYTCECGYSYTETIAKTADHTYDVQTLEVATHTNFGVIKYECQCGYSFTVSVDKVPHYYVDGVCECGEVWEGELIEMWNISAGARDDVAAYLYEDENNPGNYRLEISGYGNMWWNRIPWTSYREFITTVEINVQNDDGYTLPPNALRDFTALRHVKIGEGLRVIGRDAFRRCSTLETIELPKSLMSIEINAFAECTELRAVYGTENVQKIGDSAFINCILLEKIDELKNVYYVGYRAFANCRQLYSITLGNNERDLTIRPAAFEMCRELKTAVLYGEITEIPDRAFRECNHLITVVVNNTIPVKRIGVSAFEGCYNLQFATFEGGVYEIMRYAFSRCQSLIGVNLGKEVYSIGQAAFRDCRSLNELVFTGFLYNVEPYAFQGCNKLTVYADTYEVYDLLALGGYRKEFTDLMFHSHDWEDDKNYKCFEHVSGTDYSGEFEIVCPGHYSDGIIVVICSCGAPHAVFIPRYEEHEFYKFEKINKKTHMAYCYCGDATELEHSFEDSRCVDCGYEKKSVLEIEDFEFMGLSVKENEDTDGFERISCELLFDGVIDFESAVNLGMFEIISSGFAFNVSTEEINGVIIYTDAILNEKASYSVEQRGEYSTLVITVKIDEPSLREEIRPYFFEIGSDMSFYNMVIQIENQFDFGDTWYNSWFSEIQFSLGVRELNVKEDVEKDEIIVSKDDDLNEEENTETITLMPGDVEWIRGKGKGKLRVQTKFGEVVFNRQALEKICEASKGITVSITRTTDARGRVKYSISVCDQDGNALLPPEESDKNGDITIHVKFKTGKDNVNLKVEFHGKDENGNDYTEDKTIHGYDKKDGMISFGTSHFSDYVIYDMNEDMSGIVDGLITFKGYSMSETTSAISLGYGINYEIAKEYEELMGTSLDFGVLFASKELLEGSQPLDASGNAVELETGKVLKSSLAGYSYTSYDFILCDLTEDLYDHSFVIAGYAVTDNGVMYFQENGRSTEVYGVSYNEINSADEEIEIIE